MDPDSSTQATPQPRHLHLVCVGVIILCLIIALLVLSQQMISLPPNDFNLYWASSKLLLGGRNPYDLAGLLEYQIIGGSTAETPVLMYYPPWTLLFILPVGILDRQLSQLFWLLINTAIIFFSADQLWLYFDGSPKLRWVAWLAAFTFGPTFSALGYTGQITPIMLLGLTGFLLFHQRPGKEWLAGAFLLFAAIKPQVVYLFFVILILWLIHQRRWKLMIGFIAAIAAATSIVIFFYPSVILKFIANLTGNTPVAWATPTIGTYIRYYFHLAGFWIQFFPPAITTIVMIIIWYHHRSHWNWRKSLPWVLLLSLITSPYTWTYDYTPLVIPLLAGFVHLIKQRFDWISFFLILLYIVIDFLYWRLHLSLTDFYFIWFIPALIIWYRIVQCKLGSNLVPNHHQADPI